jgi:hypothetical protein
MNGFVRNSIFDQIHNKPFFKNIVYEDLCINDFVKCFQIKVLPKSMVMFISYLLNYHLIQKVSF